MTVYAKIENNKLITAYNGYNGITGLADSPALCEANGFETYTEEHISGYFSGTHQIIDGVLTEIINTSEYKLSQFQKDIQYQHDAFNEFSLATNSQIKTLEALYNANIRANNTVEATKLEALIESLEDDLLAEQQAVIARINAITEEYNAST